jgi:hypothetical protein
VRFVGPPHRVGGRRARSLLLCVGFVDFKLARAKDL